MEGFVKIGIIGILIASIVGSCQSQIPNWAMDGNYVKRQINCLVSSGPCDIIGRQIKALLPDVVNNNCRSCTPYQANIARNLIRFMEQRYPAEWRMILQYYRAPHNHFEG